MNHFQTLGHCLDIIMQCLDEELKNLGFLEYFQSLRDTIPRPEWKTLEGYFILLAENISRKEQQK